MSPPIVDGMSRYIIFGEGLKGIERRSYIFYIASKRFSLQRIRKWCKKEKSLTGGQFRLVHFSDKSYHFKWLRRS